MKGNGKLQHCRLPIVPLGTFAFVMERACAMAHFSGAPSPESHGSGYASAEFAADREFDHGPGSPIAPEAAIPLRDYDIQKIIDARRTRARFFDDSLSDTVQGQAPYTKGIAGRLHNTADGIYNQGGSQLVLAAAAAGSGYAATFNIALQV